MIGLFQIIDLKFLFIGLNKFDSKMFIKEFSFVISNNDTCHAYGTPHEIPFCKIGQNNEYAEKKDHIWTNENVKTSTE